MKSDNLKKVEISKTVEGQSYSQSSGNSNLGGAFYKFYYRPEASRVRSSSSLLMVLLGGELALGVSLEMGLLLSLTSPPRVTRTNKTHVDDADAQFVSKVLGTTEDHWHKVFQAEGGPTRSPN